MPIASAIQRFALRLDPRQIEVVGHLEGPLLARAGPGAGKTRVLVWRLVNLLMLDAAAPREIIMLAFGNVAAVEMRQRVSLAARSVGYRGDVDQVGISTIHSLSGRILSAHHGRVGLQPGYRVLNREAQRGFMIENFQAIFGPRQRGFKIYGWKNPQQIITKAAKSFDLITEEDISPRRLVDSGNHLHELIGRCYLAYEEALLKSNLTDFSHLLLWADDVLRDDRIAEDYGARTRQIMVDEYQDVSRIMERIVLRVSEYHDNPAVVGDADQSIYRLRVSEYHDNPAVVGDADQSIYRFRGAGPEALLGFPDHFADCRVVTLDTNYRSHPRIVKTCNRLIIDNHRNGDGFDHESDRLMVPHSMETHPDYPAVFTVFGWEAEEELGQLVDIVRFLRRNEVVDDYSQIAILLHSVKDSVSRPYVEAFADAGVHVDCRAQTSDVAHLDPGHFRNCRRESVRSGELSIMTMHASKGLEWPVVIVATAEPAAQQDDLDSVLRRYSRRRNQEPPDRVAANDRRRQFYVACTRAQNLLVLTGSAERPPSPVFDSVWHELPAWPSIDQAQLARQRFGSREKSGPGQSGKAMAIDRLEHLRWQPKA